MLPKIECVLCEALRWPRSGDEFMGSSRVAQERTLCCNECARCWGGLL